jgi:predicted NUDIX family phosphoesterase
MVLQDISDPSEEKYFIYSRGAKGGESRLYGKCSLGLGGHIEEEPTSDKNLYAVLADTAARELEEEIGIDAYKYPDLFEALQQSVKNAVLHYSPVDSVSCVHCAVMMVVPFDRQHFNEKLQEEGVIEKGQWLTLAEISAQQENKEIELEAWSLAVLEKMR